MGLNQRWQVDIRPDGAGAVTIVLPGNLACGDAEVAPCTSDGRPLSADVRVTVPGPTVLGALSLNVDPIAGDDTVNIAERRDGFAVTGDTGSETGVTVTVSFLERIRETALSADADNDGTATWSVQVPGDQTSTYITGPSVNVTVRATKAGYQSPQAERRTFARWT